MRFILTIFIVFLHFLVALANDNDKAANIRFNPTNASSNLFTNSIGMNFVLISPGTFLMGSPKEELGHDYTEEQHKVSITKGFYMQATEVTQGQWERVMGYNPSFFLNCGKDCPVENVSFKEVEDFIKKLNEIEKGHVYRLPTEAEWEYACRAGTTTPYNNGGTITDAVTYHNEDLERIAWYYANSKEGTHPVGLKEPNNWGLYDMHGNVWEWTQDWYSRYPFGYRTDQGGPPHGWSKVRRGGSWRESPFFCRSAYRSSSRPEVRAPDMGFRLVMEIPEPKAPERPALVTETKVEGPLCKAVEDVYFDLDSDKIRDDMRPILDRVVQMSKEDKTEVHISGHTCDLASDAYNMDLSKRRVNSVKNYLINKGVAAEKIYATYFGESRPRVPNTDEEHRRLNRRVEIRLFVAEPSAR